MMGAPNDDTTQVARRILDCSRTFAVVGASPRASRPSHGVMRALLDDGYRVIPVRPHADDILGLSTYLNLASIPEHIHVDVVDIFRRSEFAGAHVDEAIARGGGRRRSGCSSASSTTMPPTARQAGLDVVMDRCPAIELRRPAA